MPATAPNKAKKLKPIFVIVPRKFAGKKPPMLADPRKLADPPVTQDLSQARAYAQRRGGQKFLGNHRDLRRRFKCTRLRTASVK